MIKFFFSTNKDRYIYVLDIKFNIQLFLQKYTLHFYINTYTLLNLYQQNWMIFKKNMKIDKYK